MRRFTGAVSWSPYTLPRSLVLGAVDFARTELLTISTGVSALIDPASGTTFVQATGAAQPTTPVAGWAAFDGVDDHLAYTAGAISWPNSGEFEIWAVVNLTGTGVNTIIAWPNSGTGLGLVLRVNATIPAIIVGNGTANVPITGATGFTGKHLVRALVYSDMLALDIDAVRTSTTAVVPALGSATRYRIGANNSASAGGFWQGSINSIFITRRLPTATADAMYAYLAARRDAV